MKGRKYRADGGVNSAAKDLSDKPARYNNADKIFDEAEERLWVRPLREYLRHPRHPRLHPRGEGEERLPGAEQGPGRRRGPEDEFGDGGDAPGCC